MRVARTSAKLRALPHLVVRAEGHDAKLANFDGGLLQELLQPAGLEFGGEMRADLTVHKP